ncbi:MAG TPA: cytochrome P450 [Frankiaceae bacterium]|nr:cytochrome P450 [Frankiaceae bacterium]
MRSDPLTVDLHDARLWQDPYPVWRQAMDQHRTARTTRGELILLRADDLDFAVCDPAFVQLGVGALEMLGISDGPFHEWRRLTMAAVDGPDHERKRSLVARAFTPRRVERLRASLRKHASHLLDDATAGDATIDVVKDYAADLPLWLVCEFLGLPTESRDEIDEFLTGTEEAFVDPMTPERRERAETGIVALYGFVEGLIAERSRQPAEDLVSDLLEAERAGRADRAELVALVVNVIGGAVGSSRVGIANAILLLLSHPEQARWVAQDPDRVRPAVEECLRFYPPFRAGRRKAIAEVDAFGVQLQAGETVYIARQAANRDPRRWSDPDTFDVRRPESRHYSFGYGPHFCLGQALARLDIQESVAQFLQQCPDARLLDEAPERVPFTPDDQLVALPVAIGRSRR